MSIRITEVSLANLALSFALLLGLSCQRTPPAPAEESQPVATAAASTAPQIQGSAEAKPSQAVESAVVSSAPSAPAPAPSAANGGDPVQGKFTLEDATKGLKPKGKL